MPVFNRVIDRVAADEAYLEETLAAASRCLVFVFVCKSVRGIHACAPSPSSEEACLKETLAAASSRCKQASFAYVCVGRPIHVSPTHPDTE